MRYRSFRDKGKKPTDIFHIQGKGHKGVELSIVEEEDQGVPREGHHHVLANQVKGHRRVGWTVGVGGVLVVA
jgi:hypothetical protein